MKRMATKSRKKTDSDPEPSFLCLFVIFVAKKLSSIIIFAPCKEIERLSFKRHSVGCSFQTADVLRISRNLSDFIGDNS